MFVALLRPFQQLNRPKTSTFTSGINPAGVSDVSDGPYLSSGATDIMTKFIFCKHLLSRLRHDRHGHGDSADCNHGEYFCYESL